jgi:hypothetical protein
MLGCIGLLALSACGGGGGTVAPPTAMPQPTPTPTPTPMASFRVYAASPIVGRIDFSNTILQADGIVQGFNSREGLYFPSYRNAIYGYQGAAEGGNANRDNSDKFKSAAGLDTETAMLVSLVATSDYKMVTPLTSLLFASGSDQTKLKTQLGVVGSVFAMTANPDLSSYDAIAEASVGDAARAVDAGRMAAANIRALAINSGLSAIGYQFAPEAASQDVSIGFNDGGSATLSKCLRDGPAQFIFTNDRMVSVAQCFMRNPTDGRLPQLGTTTWQAIAHLIDAYAAAIPLRVETADDRARWMLGIKGYLVPAIARVANANSDVTATAAIAVTTQTILNETARYTDHYTYNATGLFMPGPDFMTIASGATQVVDASKLRQTDLQFGAPSGGLALGGTIISVSVPNANAAQVTAALNGTSVSVTVASGFRGATWFDYITRSDAGEERPARVYVRAY